MKITCMCEAVNEIEVPSEIKADEGVLRSIADGDFMSYACSECGKKLKPELPVRIISDEKRFDIFLVPEMERRSYLNGKSEYESGKREGFINRIAVGYPELVEKIRIIETRLDDRVVEIMKYYLLLKAEETDPGSDRTLIFRELVEDRLVLHVHGMKSDEIGVMKVPMERYRQIEQSMDAISAEEPIASIVRGPYVSVNRAFD